MSNFDFNTFGTTTQKKTSGSFDIESFGTDAGPVESTPNQTPGFLRGETTFPIDRNASPTLNFAKSIANIPSSYMKMAGGVLDIPQISSVSNELLAQNGGSKIKTDIAIAKSALQDLKGLAEGGFSLWKQMGEGIYKTLENNVQLEGSTLKGAYEGTKQVGAEALGKVAEMALNDPLLIPSLLYAPKSIGKSDLISDIAKPVTTRIEAGLEKRGIASDANKIKRVELQNKDLRTAMDLSSDANAGARDRITRSNVLQGAINEDGVITTLGKNGPLERYRALTIGQNEGIVRDMLKVEYQNDPSIAVSIPEIKKALRTTFLETYNMDGKALANAIRNIPKELEGLVYRLEDKKVPLWRLQNAKISTKVGVNYNRPSTKIYAKAVARAYKNLIEKTSKLNVGEVNKVLSKFEGDLDLIESLNGKRVPGGKLGVMTSQIAGTVAGGATGALLGGIPGMIAGSVVGPAVSKTIKQRSLKRYFNGKERPMEKSPVLEKARKYAQSNKKKNTSKTIQVTKTVKSNSINNDISKTIPQKKGLVSKVINSVKESIKNPSMGLATKNVGDEATVLNRATKYLREAKGLSANDIMKKYPDIQLKRDVPVTDIHGHKMEIPEGEVLTPYELKGNKVLLQDGKTYVVSKNQFQNVKGQSLSGEAKDFAPELKGTEEVTLGHSLAYKNKQSIYFDDPRWGEGKIEIIAQDLEQRGFGNGEFSVWEGEKKIGDSMQYDEAVQFAKDHIDNSYPNAKVDLSGLKEDVKPLNTKYSQYTLPGGENYKEILIKAPNPADIRYNKELDAWQVFEKGKERARGTFPSKRGAEEWMDENGLGGKRNAFISNHWDLERDVLAHLRMNWRKYKGKAVAFLEELQSDWAREARKSQEILNKERQMYERDLALLKTEKDVVNRQAKIKALEEKLADFKSDVPQTPSNPLLKNWQELSIKRALKEAVDSNAEYFAWINGEQTSARYNLATYVDDVKWQGAKDGKWIDINAKGDKNIRVFINEEGIIETKNASVPADWKGKKLDEVLGKGLADSIMAKESGTLSGEGLKFGGEWAENLYDKQVGNIVSDLTGAKVEKLDMGLPVGTENKGWFVNDSGAERPKLTNANIKVGQSINGTQGDYIITEVLGDGKFKAVPKVEYDKIMKTVERFKGDSFIKEQMDKQLSGWEREFDISQKTTTQQGIRLTPEVIAKIKGESPLTKKPQQPPLEEFLAVRNRALNQ